MTTHYITKQINTGTTVLYCYFIHKLSNFHSKYQKPSNLTTSRAYNLDQKHCNWSRIPTIYAQSLEEHPNKVK